MRSFLSGEYGVNFLPQPIWTKINYWLESLDTTYLEHTNKNSIKVPKVFKPTNKIKLKIIKDNINIMDLFVVLKCLVVHILFSIQEIVIKQKTNIKEL